MASGLSGAVDGVGPPGSADCRAGRCGVERGAVGGQCPAFLGGLLGGVAACLGVGEVDHSSPCGSDEAAEDEAAAVGGDVLRPVAPAGGETRRLGDRSVTAVVPRVSAGVVGGLVDVDPRRARYAPC